MSTYLVLFGFKPDDVKKILDYKLKKQLPGAPIQLNPLLELNKLDHCLATLEFSDNTLSEGKGFYTANHGKTITHGTISWQENNGGVMITTVSEICENAPETVFVYRHANSESVFYGLDQEGKETVTILAPIKW